MGDLKEIVNNLKETFDNAYNIPINGYKEDGLKGGIKGIGSAIGNTLGNLVIISVDVSVLIYNKISENINEYNENKRKMEEERIRREKEEREDMFWYDKC